jgi:hypothetical protein
MGRGDPHMHAEHLADAASALGMSAASLLLAVREASRYACET